MDMPGREFFHHPSVSSEAKQRHHSRTTHREGIQAIEGGSLKSTAVGIPCESVTQWDG